VPIESRGEILPAFHKKFINVTVPSLFYFRPRGGKEKKNKKNLKFQMSVSPLLGRETFSIVKGRYVYMSDGANPMVFEKKYALCYRSVDSSLPRVTWEIFKVYKSLTTDL